MKILLGVFCFSLVFFLGCGNGEAEYYGYTEKEWDSLSPDEQGDIWEELDSVYNEAAQKRIMNQMPLDQKTLEKESRRVGNEYDTRYRW